MTSLADLIRKIPEWESLLPEDLLSKLSQKNIPYEDKSDWTWKGIAAVVNQDTGERFGRHGCKLLQDALLSAGEGLWVSQISSGMPLTDPEIQSVLRYLDQAGAVPGARFIADAVLRQISVLEKHNITTTVEEVARVQASMKLALYVEAQIDKKQDQLNSYKEAMQLWDGNPETEPRF